MTPLSVIITIAAYFAILFTVSYIAGSKADNAGFFVGNRKSSWYVVAFAMVGSAISGVTYVSVPGIDVYKRQFKNSDVGVEVHDFYINSIGAKEYFMARKSNISFPNMGRCV